MLIYKTYKDPRTYMMHGDDIVWVRSLSGYRLGVLLPKGFAFLSSNVAAQLSTTSDGRLKLAFANPSGQSNPVTIHARRTTTAFHADAPGDDMFFDDVKTIYDLGAPESHTITVDQSYSDYRKGAKATLDSLSYLPLQDLKVTDLDTAHTLTPAKSGSATTVPLEVPITNDKQSAHLRITGTLTDPAYTVERGELVFARTMKGLRNTVLLPAGWEVSAVSQSATIGTVRRPRVRVADQPERREPIRGAHPRATRRSVIGPVIRRAFEIRRVRSAAAALPARARAGRSRAGVPGRR